MRTSRLMTRSGLPLFLPPLEAVPVELRAKLGMVLAMVLDLEKGLFFLLNLGG